MFHSRKAEKINALVCNLSLCYSQLSRNQTACTAISLLLKSHCTIITPLWLEGSKIALAAKVKGERKQVSSEADGETLSASQDNTVGVAMWKAWRVGKVEASPSLQYDIFWHCFAWEQGSFWQLQWAPCLGLELLEALALLAGSRKSSFSLTPQRHSAAAAGCTCPSVA